MISSCFFAFCFFRTVNLLKGLKESNILTIMEVSVNLFLSIFADFCFLLWSLLAVKWSNISFEARKKVRRG